MLVLGEMRELGANSALEHEGVGASAARSHASQLVAVGPGAARLADGARAGGMKTVFAADAMGAIPTVLAAVTGKEVVLVKGSRAVGLERVVAALAAQGRKAPG